MKIATWVNTNVIKSKVYKNTYLFSSVFDRVKNNPTKYTNATEATHAQKYPDVKDWVFNTTAAPTSIVKQSTNAVTRIGITPRTIKHIPGLFCMKSTMPISSTYTDFDVWAGGAEGIGAIGGIGSFAFINFGI